MGSWGVKSRHLRIRAFWPTLISHTVRHLSRRHRLSLLVLVPTADSTRGIITPALELVATPDSHVPTSTSRITCTGDRSGSKNHSRSLVQSWLPRNFVLVSFKDMPRAPAKAHSAALYFFR